MNPTPVTQYGKDHWSMLAYAEAVCVDGQKGVGTLLRDRMRCNPARHPLLAGAYASVGSWKPQYGTRLRAFFEFNLRNDPVQAVAAGVQLDGHDDWDCLEDLEAAGYVEVLSLSQGTVRMTARGNQVAALLRAHKANGGMFANFVLESAASCESPETPACEGCAA